MLNHSFRVGSAIDVIAKENYARVQLTVTRALLQPILKAFKGFETPMDITDGINPDTLR
jgi:hypothetical protein